MRWQTDVRARRACAALLAALVVRSFFPAFASAAPLLDVHVRRATLSPDGSTNLVVSVTGAHDVPKFSVSEQGRAIEGVTVRSLSSGAQTLAVALAMDVSGSTAGTALAGAKRAAKDFVTALPATTRIELIAFGARASVAVLFTTDRARISKAIDGLVARGETALYDAVALAARTAAQQKLLPGVVVFTDGRDTTSKLSLASAIVAAKHAGTPVTAIGLATHDLDLAALRSLATSTGGRVVSAATPASLATAFSSAAHDLSDQYVLTYTVKGKGTQSNLDLAVTALAGGATATDRIATVNTRTGAPAATVTRALSPVQRFFATKAGLYAAGGAFFLALLGLFLSVATRARSDEASNLLQRISSRNAATLVPHGEDETGLAGNPLGRAALAVMDKLPRRKGLEDRMQISLDRAGWPLRATEFLLVRAGTSIAGFAIGGVLIGKLWFGIVLTVVGAMVPKAVLERKVRKRQAAFLSQLPDSLQMLSGSLRAGGGFLQSVDTLVKEVDGPMREEFSRVLTQARLGMPLDEALTLMADRIDSDDFRWVVLATNIQRQVGGNLAGLLETVAGTLRERDMVRNQIKVLAAEGKLSATILTVLPFLLAGYIMLVNPTYLSPLIHETTGRIMVAGALGMMGAGIGWMRKIIRIDV